MDDAIARAQGHAAAVRDELGQGAMSDHLGPGLPRNGGRFAKEEHVKSQKWMVFVGGTSAIIIYKRDMFISFPRCSRDLLFASPLVGHWCH